ncbi:MAG: NAD(P)-binding domain-containing protein, partial [Planctomycetota bacterium]
MSNWEQKIKGRRLRVGVLGLGYVGLPLVRAFAEASLKVLGFDTDQSKVKALNSGRSIIKHIPDSDIRRIVDEGRFEATSDMSRMNR